MNKHARKFSGIDDDTVNENIVLTFAILLMHKMKHGGIIDEDNKYDIKIVKYPKYDTPRDNYCFSFEFEYFGKRRMLSICVEEDWAIHFNLSMPSGDENGGWIILPIFKEYNSVFVFSSQLKKMDADFNRLRQAIRNDILKEAIKFIGESEHIDLNPTGSKGNTKFFDIVSDNEKFASMRIKIKVVGDVKFTMIKKQEDFELVMWSISMSPKKFYSCLHGEIEQHAKQK